ncbi:class I SAM-dependent methyltransferase [Anaerolineales bacterium HSG6]|nr:class I SAM-dependent methyltransferase [Anaerolineales bacterium HSG6]MDM8531327.1 class I SAM-dependent methyltransferase [Anaerolineales bacterium HSG25]
MFDLLITYGPLLFQITLLLSLTIVISSYMANFFGGMWVPSSLETVRKMLQLADLQPGQTLVDLGAGDGRVVLLAARQFEANAIGVEIDPLRTLFANSLILLLGLRHRAWIYYADVFNFDLTGADVVVMYLTKATNNRLKPRLLAQLEPGTKVITRFAIPGWSARLLDDNAMIFLYEIDNSGPEIETELVVL